MTFKLEALNQNLSFTYQEIKHPRLLAYIKKEFSNQGVLKSDERGFFYLKIEDDYILKLFPMLKEDEELKKNNLMLPDYFFPGAAGAHISVIYPEECQSAPQVEELGQVFEFELLDLLEVRVFDKQFYVIRVFAPQLEQLRNKYSLDRKLNYHGLLVPFHITIAISFL